MDLSRQFSRDLKIQKINYQYGESVNDQLIKKHLGALKRFALNSLIDDRSKKAFWINVYNGLTNYLIIQLEIKKTMKEIHDVFKMPFLHVGGLKFSLDEIEHGVLRQNKRNVFDEKLAKQKLTVSVLDYRIHFALNCGANSCPAIAFYTAENIEEELVNATNVFVKNEFKVDHDAKKIVCSAIFDWYKKDFKSIYLDDYNYSDYEVEFTEYDWSI